MLTIGCWSGGAQRSSIWSPRWMGPKAAEALLGRSAAPGGGNIHVCGSRLAIAGDSAQIYARWRTKFRRASRRTRVVGVYPGSCSPAHCGRFHKGGMKQMAGWSVALWK